MGLREEDPRRVGARLKCSCWPSKRGDVSGAAQRMADDDKFIGNKRIFLPNKRIKIDCKRMKIDCKRMTIDCKRMKINCKRISLLNKKWLTMMKRPYNLFT